jgi:predicted  nucleic acid-binding Zn-ribbon protein
MSQVRQLYKLQQIDTEIRQKKQRLGEVIQLQRETEELLAARQRAQGAGEELQTWQTRQNELDLELGSLSSEAQRTDQRLYSGNVKNPKELEDLQNKVLELGRRRAALEDEILEAMIMIEDAQEEKESADQSLSDVHTAWKKSQESLQQEQNELALRLHELMAARQKQIALIEKPLLANYEQMRSHKGGGVAVAGLVDKRCTGCHLTVSAIKVTRAERGEIVTCGGCGRILNPL